MINLKATIRKIKNSEFIKKIWYADEITRAKTSVHLVVCMAAIKNQISDAEQAKNLLNTAEKMENNNKYKEWIEKELPYWKYQKEELRKIAKTTLQEKL